MTELELWSTSQCAAHCGIAVATWRSYRRLAREGRTGWTSLPKPVGAQPGGGQDLYDAAEVRAWHAARPGQGARTDLRTT